MTSTFHIVPTFSDFLFYSNINRDANVFALTGRRRNWAPDLWSAEEALHSPTLTGPPNLPGNLETASKECCAPYGGEAKKKRWRRRAEKGKTDQKRERKRQVVQLQLWSSWVCRQSGMSGCKGMMGRFWMRTLQAPTKAVQVCLRQEARPLSFWEFI